jgi:hypothetical protein
MSENRVRSRQSVKQFGSEKPESSSQKHLLAAHRATFCSDWRMSGSGNFPARFYYNIIL